MAADLSAYLLALRQALNDSTAPPRRPIRVDGGPSPHGA